MIGYVSMVLKGISIKMTNTEGSCVSLDFNFGYLVFKLRCTMELPVFVFSSGICVYICY